MKKLTYFLLIIFISTSCVTENKKSNKEPNNNSNTVPEGVSSACFCMDALAGGSLYNPTTKQVRQCKAMYKCWNNAQADCLLGTSNIWTKCEL